MGLCASFAKVVPVCEEESIQAIPFNILTNSIDEMHPMCFSKGLFHPLPYQYDILVTDDEYVKKIECVQDTDMDSHRPT